MKEYAETQATDPLYYNGPGKSISKPIRSVFRDGTSLNFTRCVLKALGFEWGALRHVVLNSDGQLAFDLVAESKSVVMMPEAWRNLTVTIVIRFDGESPEAKVVDVAGYIAKNAL